MNSLAHPQHLVERLIRAQPNLTQLRAIAKEVGKNQETADFLWKQGETNARLLALLIVDLKTMSVQAIERIIADIEVAEEQDQRQLCDWLIANVIMKKSSLKNEATQWRLEQSVIKRRVFWSVQARTIKAEHQERNTHLLESLETSMAGADTMIQEVMNWCAAQIGIEDPDLRKRCIRLGERVGSVSYTHLTLPTSDLV